MDSSNIRDIITFLTLFFISIIILSSSIEPSYALYLGHDIKITDQMELLSLLPKQVTATEKGDVYVVWTDNSSIYFSSSFGNQNKFNPVANFSNSGQSASSPQLDGTEKGDVYVTWVVKNNKTGNSNIEFINSNDSGSTFSPQKKLNGGKSDSISPQLAATEKGDVYVVWVDKNSTSGDSDIQFISSNDRGMTFNPRKELSASSFLSSSPQLAATEKGDVYVVWVDINNMTGYSNIEYIHSNDSGKTFSPNTQLRAGNTLTFTPQIAATEKGDVHVVWVDKSSKTGDTDINIRSTYDEGRTFDDRKRLRSNDLLSFSPQMAATERGEVYAVWTDRNSTTAESQISFRASHDGGKTFDRVINLDKDRKNLFLLNSSSPQLAVAGNGTVYVVWVDDQIQFKEILVNDAIVGNPISLSNKTTSSLSPQLTVADNGNAYVFWIDKSYTMERSLHFKKISEYLFDRNS